MLSTLFSSPAVFFTVPGLLGIVFVALKLVLGALGAADHDGDFSGGHGADAGHDATSGHDHAGGGLQLFTLQSVMSFLMGFGWGGLLGLEVLAWGVLLSAVLAIAIGTITMYAQALLWKSMYSLQTSGNVAIGSAKGREGVVYVAIPPAGKGAGQVRVVIDGKQRLFSALTSTSSEIPSQTRVRVVGVNDDNTLTVEAVGV